MVCKLYSTQSPFIRHSLHDLNVTNHSQPLDRSLHAKPQSDQSQTAVRLCTAYNMPLYASGLRRQTILDRTIGWVHYQTPGLTG